MALTAAGWSDAQSLVAAINPEFERLHPRGGDGRFIPKPGGWVRFLDVAHGLWVKAEVMEDMTGDGKFKVKEVASGVEHLKKKSELFSTPQPKATLKPSSMKKSADQSRSGSNVGATFEDDDGSKWYVKTPQSKLHAANENFANRLYREAGSAAPETAVSPDGKNFMTKIEKSDDWHVFMSNINADEEKRAKVLDAIAKDFVIDAWLANWDAPVNDNLRITPEGVPLRVDAGGSVMFRARGGRRDLGPMVGELKSMRDPSTSFDGSRAYANVTREHEIDATKRILAISPSRLKEMAHEDGLPSVVADELIARRAYLATHYGLELPENTEAGMQALAALAESKTDEDAAERARKAVVKTVVRLAPDAAVTLGPGAPVWVKDKKDPNIVADGKIPDIMIVDTVAGAGMRTPDGGKSDGTFFWLKSRDGRVKAGNVPRTAIEPLRENFASESAEYKTGERPQIGDLVEFVGGEQGVLSELYPLYGKVVKANGETKVVRIKSSKLVAKSGTHDLAKAGAEGEITLSTEIVTEVVTDIGPLADVTNPVSNFPLVAFSLPHRASVLVLSYDAESEKATVMLGDYRKVAVPASKLYDDAKVDRAKVEAMPTRTRGPRAVNNTPKAFVPFDTSKLETKKDWRVNTNVVIDEFRPGDRLIKAKNTDTNQILFFRVYTSMFGSRQIEFVGGSKSSRRMTDTTDYNTKKVHEAFRNDASFIWQQLQKAEITEATPAKYDQAAWEAEVGKSFTLLNLIPRDKKITIKGRKLDPSITVEPTSSYSRAATLDGKEVEVEIPVVPGQKIIVLPDPNGQLLGVKYRKTPVIFRGKTKKDDGGINQYEHRQERVPRFVVERNGKHYDTGSGGEFLKNPAKWTEIDPMTWKNFQENMVNGYWSAYYDEPVPVVEMPWGKFDYIDYDTVPTHQAIGEANRQAVAIQALNGNLSPDERPTGWRTKWKGDISIQSLLEKLPNWDKGSLDTKKDAHEAAEQMRLARITASKYPTGSKIEKTSDLDDLLPGTLIKTELTLAGRNELVKTVYEGDESKLQDSDVISYRLKTDDGKWTKAKQGTDGSWTPADTPDNWITSDKVSIPPEKLGETSVEKTPGNTSSVAGGEIPDVTSIQGFDALTHKLDTSREKIMSGAYDKRLDEIMRTDYDAQMVQAQTKYSHSYVPKISDGTSHGDPRMAQYVLDHGGDKKSLVVPASVFKMILDVTGADADNWRFVANAEQRDAIKYGDHFNGTGVSGNGVYSGPRGAANGYGSAGAQITMRPGGKAIENGDAALGAGEDIARSTQERHDLLASVTHLYDTKSIAEYDPTTSEFGRDLIDQMKAEGRSQDFIDELTSLAAFKAAVSVAESAKRAKWAVTVKSGSSSYYSNSYNQLEVVAMAPGGGGVRLVFKKPATSGTRGWGALQADKIDDKINFNMQSAWMHRPDNVEPPKERRNYGSYSASGTFFDDTTEILEKSGFLEALALPGSQAALHAAIEKSKQIDSRISFMSDPGRWALAAGYDNMTVPSSRFNIFLHRTAFIIKK